MIHRARLDEANRPRQDHPARHLVKSSCWLLRSRKNVTRVEDQVRLNELRAANRAEFLKTLSLAVARFRGASGIATWACVVESTSACNAFRYRSRHDRASGALWTLCNDGLFDGRLFRMLTVVDQYSRQSSMVVACSEGSFPVRKVANQRTALLAFLKGLPAGSRIGVESTGSYHELFAEAAHKLGFLVFLLNPKDTRHYAKTVGLRGKTDRVDAELIARMIAHEHTKLHAWIPPTPQQRELDRLIKRRATLISLREAVAMSLHELGGLADDLKALRTRFNQLIARLDLRVKALVEASPERKQNCTRLCTISGVGPIIGTALVNTLERVPLKSADAFVAFTGLDPRPDDSGQHRGKRRLSKRGPAELRRLLYLAAMSAAKTKTWRPLYEHYRAKGLSTTATLVILARRIARTAWSIYTHKTEFDPARLTKPLT
jgi:transposase